MQILPAILATSEEIYQEQITKVIQSKLFDGDWIQIDLMDGKFVSNKSIDPDILIKYPNVFKKEIQLLVADPASWVEKLSKIPVHRIVAPVEVGEGQISQFIQKTKAMHIQVGLSLNLGTPIESLAPFMDIIDSVLVMSAEPGAQGREFSVAALEKIRQIKKRWNIQVGDDGGVNSKNSKALQEAGVDYLAIGSGLLKGDFDENFKKIRRTLSA
ncbi:hypothetical protein A2631_03910 [Candidatus Daviesbacteria bacterium RIFCSPHIGHO2_01_FULL_44_29]|uniref:Ribulose-phosphate 3-epimerase n=1 Tax=Candidatus Daviesbacteria bacterium RIFCSPHIGHO2_02_FULL_43_12 TaxID=1797776 RepID=A0A1F5KG13_9BACT|nr:MAG: hypothetical protein A2631_03910 [Candidatus Daviesbacteria bacterium RIFCSPHIGHO2_01_FULL_44_29]OGE39877.1 MAG: hypothetical protein A3D25_03640 [Candidatus Daviesbacteria bacterium RIFCSPHIGHO2_02_FULL_43_12]OGE40674.1 MAG: hypothetical protein A3E86_04190 [Candidatus Daviesbacteria bacterium RIFCSPHIGHO2_12_FULL_47_45]OGE70442.1 MAG: hypothetical protein A3B55_01930 [Candidatus Daviesbacteria bacterium RIFCSPLOWO2_01_FULL_43_15]